MATTQAIYASITVSMTDLRRNPTPMARSNSPTRGHPKFPQARQLDYDDSGLLTMRAAASLSR